MVEVSQRRGMIHKEYSTEVDGEKNKTRKDLRRPCRDCFVAGGKVQGQLPVVQKCFPTCTYTGYSPQMLLPEV